MRPTRTGIRLSRRARIAPVALIIALAVSGCTPLTPLTKPSTEPPLRTPGASAPPEGAVDWSEARSLVGSTATVCGEVISTFTDVDGLGQPTFINLGVDYPDPAGLTVIIFGEYRANFPVDPAVAYLGTTLCATGEVRAHDEFVQIEARTPDQLAVQG